MSYSKTLNHEERSPLCEIRTDEPSGDAPSNIQNDPRGDEMGATLDELERMHLRRLYISHFLSTWNTRTYEFATVSVEPCS